MSNYIISDAAKIINVENHVLRNWEEELSLHIPRNDLGHRIYTDENILQLKTIKKLKYYGFSLKHIKSLLPYLHKIDTLSTKELLNLKDNFFTILQTKPSYSTHDNTISINSSINNSTYDNTSSIDKLKPIIHYIITDFIITILTSKDTNPSPQKN